MGGGVPTEDDNRNGTEGGGSRHSYKKDKGDNILSRIVFFLFSTTAWYEEVGLVK